VASFVVGPLATFARPLVDEELPTLASLSEWSIDMDLTPARGAVELSTAPTYPRRILSAPKLAHQHDHNMRCVRG
jgi:hypothetical protein